MPDLPAVPPEAYEAAKVAYVVEINRDRVIDTPAEFEMWPALSAAVNAAAPILVAEGRRQAAEAIRSEIARLRAGAVDSGATRDDLEWAARIAEGNTDATVVTPNETVQS